MTRIIQRHAELLAYYQGEHAASRDIRKHISWYLRGYSVGGELRRSLATITSLDALRTILEPYASSELLPNEAQSPRGRQGSPSKVILPEGWLNDPDDDTVPHSAEIMHSGG